MIRGCAMLTLACSLLAAVTAAPAAAAELLEEVIVTARKVTEASADLPLAIDVIHADALPAGMPLDLERLAALSPGLYFESLWGGTGSAPVLRGQSQPSTAGDNVGVFVDGVYQAERTAIDSAPIDVERVEIVRGPQSALFGRSTFAGAIHYVPRLPTAELATGLELAVGSDDYLASNAYVSGPLPGPLLGRLAASYRNVAGTSRNSADGESLGDVEQTALAGTLLSDWEGPWSARLSGRWTAADLVHLPTATVAGDAYNCGAIDPSTNLWSYYCGSLPTTERYAVSPDMPDSTLDLGQATLVVRWSAHNLDFSSTTSYYRGSTARYRDFDATATGEAFGVCELPACPRGAGPAQPVVRQVNVDAVSRSSATTSEWSQEFALRGTPAPRIAWLAGLMGFASEQAGRSAFGFEQGDLTADERLTVLLPLTPLNAGPVARANSFLVDDPAQEQVTQSSTASTVHSFALFAALDYRFDSQWAMRAEARVTREYLDVAGNPNSPRKFTDTTPRLSLQYEPDAGSMFYLSAAKGSRSGGINTALGLAPGEQTYAPEYNWTYELGARLERARWRADATAFYIDWHNTQLLGFPETPGINTLITRNTAGVRTDGIELQFEARLHERLAMRGAYSHASSGFAAGSDDPGSAAFCGLRAGSTGSSFCNVGPPRSGSGPTGAYVPYIDGNRLPRAPADQAALSFTGDLTPASVSDWELQAVVDASYQGDVYDRAINGARFGERGLLSARISWTRGPWMLQLWGTNLTDELYVRSVSSRGAAYYPVSPRPLDLVFGYGRRVGLTVRYTP